MTLTDPYFLAALQPSMTSVVVVDLVWFASGDRVDCISSEFQRCPLLGVIFVAIVDAIGDAALAPPAMVRDPLPDVLRDAEAAHEGAYSAAEIVHGNVFNAQLGPGV